MKKLTKGGPALNSVATASALVQIAKQEMSKARSLAEQARTVEGAEHQRLLDEAKQAFEKAQAFTQEAKQRVR